MKYKLIVKGTGFTSQSLTTVTVLEECLFFITEDGLIAKIIQKNQADYSELVAKYSQQANYYELAPGQYLLPGMVDLHIHAPQWAQAGRALDLPLQDWLHQYTFPLEAKFADVDFADHVYRDLVEQLIANGTTTGLYFASIHEEASYRLAEICAEKGQRGLVGKVVMDDHEQNPDFYRDGSTAEALASTESFIQRVQQLNKTTIQGVYPVVTPRFIPSCTDEALAGLGALAKKYDVHIQSHCSESDWEHQYVADRFSKNDAFALNDFQLLSEKAVMAHCNHLSLADRQLFAETGTAIAACPISNAYFANGVLPIKEITDQHKIDIGLGTDLSGGFSSSLFDNIKQSVISSRMLEDGVDVAVASNERGKADSRITLNQAFYHGTAGGGQALSLPIGQLAEGYLWDALVIDTKLSSHPLPLFMADEDLLDVFQTIIYLSHSENIVKVWIHGESVKETKGAN
ncbi:guanine deaminase [Vagococcus salmoninarum]|uniref:guanine deaminase n=1 Tax=Vagococcus salmoninarum TaxID=2739 RepID=UPI003F9B8C85